MNASLSIPENEKERLAALRRYHILDTEREGAFDQIARMAASMFGAPIGSINFVDADRVWIKAGADISQLPRNLSFCSEVVKSDKVLVIPDTMKSRRWRDNPIVMQTGPRFYAGAPLVTRDGYRIGTLCVIDFKPRPCLSRDQRQWLTTLAKVVMNELDLRLELQARVEAERDLQLVNELIMAITEAPTARDALEISLRIIAKAVHAVHGVVLAAIAHNDMIRMVAGYGVDPFWRNQAEYTRMRPIRRSDSLAGWALSQDRPVIYEIDSRGGRFPHMDQRFAGIAATCIGVPIIQGGQEFTINLFFVQSPADAETLARRIGDLAAKVRPALVRKLSEERIAILQSVALHANDAAVVLVPDNVSDPASRLHIAYVNPAMTRMTGYRLDELVGRPSSVLWKDHDDLVALETGTLNVPLRRELECRHKDGSVSWIDINAVPVSGGTEEGRHVVAILRDTTERRALEKALREREQTFHLMFSAAPVPMMLLDVKAQRYVEVNDAAIRLLGYSREQFLSMSAEAIRAPDELERYKAVMHTPVPTSGRRGVWRYIAADGQELTVDVSVHPFRAQGRAMAIIVTVDVTEQKRAEEQIRQARDAAEAVSRAKSDLLANMSHELRTPLNAIIGFSQIMREELFGPLGASRYRSYVGDILESAHHLLAVINDILDLAKIEANSLRLKEKIVDPNDVVASALRLVRPRADESGIGLDFDRAKPSVAAMVDEIALKRVLVNLLTNAIKFSEAGTRVEVRCGMTGDGGLSLVVADHGIGMDADEIPIALTPFQQVDIGLRRKYEGTGLGLPIAKQLMELHGGELTITSARGVGTTVILTLPASRIVTSTLASGAYIPNAHFESALLISGPSHSSSHVSD